MTVVRIINPADVIAQRGQSYLFPPDKIKGNSAKHEKRIRSRDNLGIELARFLNPNVQGFSANTPVQKKEKKQVTPENEIPECLRFKPYEYPTPGKSQVKIKRKDDKEKKFLTVEYDVNATGALKRSEVELDGVSVEIEKSAKSVAALIIQESKSVDKLYDEYKASLSKSRSKLDLYKSSGIAEHKLEARRLWDLAMSKKKILDESLIRPHSIRMDIKVFQDVYTKYLNQVVQGSTNDTDLDLFTLTTYLCLKKKGGFLSKLPNYFLDEDDLNLLQKTRTLTRYFLVNQKGINAPGGIEKLSDWTSELTSCGLQTLSDYFSPVDLLKISYPGYLDGPYPIIKEWLLPSGSKWQNDKILLKRACKNIFYSQGVVENGVINRTKVLEADWGKVFNDPKNGLRGVFAGSDYISGALDALRLATPSLIGTDVANSQIPPWKFAHLVQWKTKEGLKILDDLTRYLVEQKLKLFEKDGEIVSAEKIKKVKDWKKQYFAERYLCLVSSGVGTAEAALKRVYPHLFGWGEGQILPGELNTGGRWKDKDGVKLFRLRFAHSIYSTFEKLKKDGIKDFKNHGVRLNLDADPPLVLPKHDFTKLTNFYTANNIYWWKHILYFNLGGGFNRVANQNQVKAFEVLLGKVNEDTGCFGKTEIKVSEVHEQNPINTALIIDLLTDLDTPYEPEQIKINGLRTREYDLGYTGIQDSCLEPLLIPDSQDDISEKTRTLYEAYAAAITPLNESEIDANSALEQMLMVKCDFGGNTQEYLLSDKNLRTLIRTLRTNILDNVNISSELKYTLKVFIGRLISLHSPNTPRDVLLTAARTNRQYGMENNALSVLNFILEHIFEAIAIHEIRHFRNHGLNTDYYGKILEKVDAKDVLE